MNAKRVLIVRVGAMGDVLHALPAATALREARPEWAIDWVVDPRWAPLLVNEGEDGCGPVVSRVHLAEARLWSRSPFSRQTRRSVLALRRALAAARYDAVVDMQGTLRSAVLGSFASVRSFYGYAHPRERGARWFYKQPLPTRGIHVVEQGAALLGESLGLRLQPPRTVPLPGGEELSRPSGRVASIFAQGEPFALLAPAAGWGAKQWPAAHFAALARSLASLGFAVLVNAARADDPVPLSVAHGSDGAAQVFPCTVEELITLTRRAALVVGGDSGPVHLAAAHGTPLVALYGPTDPARNGPWGAGPTRILRHPSSPTSYRHVAAADPGLAQISPEEAFAAALSVLGRETSNLDPSNINPEQEPRPGYNAGAKEPKKPKQSI